MHLNNLEHLKFGEIKDKEGKEYSQFRKKLHPNFLRVWIDIFLLYFIQAGIFIFMFVTLRQFSFSSIIITLCCAVLIGFFLASLNLFIHEAAHFNIHANKKTNDILANIFIGVWFGINVKSYRIVHWKHHEKLGTIEDTEHSYFNGLTWKFIFEILFGIHLLRIILSRSKTVNASSPTINHNKSLDKIMLLCGMLANLSLLLFAFYLQNYFWIAAWIIGMFSMYPFFNSIRQLLEHRDEHARTEIDYTVHNHGKVTRYFSFNLFSYFFGGAGFDKHLIHHWDPQISYTRLHDVENFLKNHEESNEIVVHSKTNYFHTFIKLMK